MTPFPYLQEFASRRPALWSGYYAGDDSPGALLRASGEPYRGLAGLYRLFNEMEDKDGHLFSVLQTRKNGVLSRPRTVRPATEDERGRTVARFVEEALAGVPNFDAALMQALDALGKGFAALEVLWERRGATIVIRDVVSRFAGRFAFEQGRGAGRLLLTEGGVSGAPVPERKFLTVVFNARNGSPYGQGLCEKAYWYYWFKKNNLKFWVAYNERFGSPTVVARYRPGATDEEQSRLLEVIDSIRHDAGVAIPDSVAIELLEAQRGGSARTYAELADWCNDEISKIVLGQTLTTAEGRRAGSLALGRVHEAVRNEYIESDARTLMAVVNEQLIRWLVDFNFGPGVPAPRWVIDTSLDENLNEQVEVDGRLMAMGVPLSAEYFYRRYGRPAPAPSERALVYDDRNLYQYHLEHGVLTINEVRRALGLAPASWGDRPTREREPRREADGAGRASGESKEGEKEAEDREEYER
jgi:phage gp29-like protein